MKIGKFEILWSDLGKIIAGIATIAISYFVFLQASSAIRIVTLIVLVGLFFLYKHLLMKNRMPPNLERDLKSEDERKKYG